MYIYLFENVKINRTIIRHSKLQFNSIQYNEIKYLYANHSPFFRSTFILAGFHVFQCTQLSCQFPGKQLCAVRKCVSSFITCVQLLMIEDTICFYIQYNTIDKNNDVKCMTVHLLAFTYPVQRYLFAFCTC